MSTGSPSSPTPPSTTAASFADTVQSPQRASVAQFQALPGSTDMLIPDSRTSSLTSSKSDYILDMDFDSTDTGWRGAQPWVQTSRVVLSDAGYSAVSRSSAGSVPLRGSAAENGGADFEMGEEDDSCLDNEAFLNLLFIAELSLNGCWATSLLPITDRGRAWLIWMSIENMEALYMSVADLLHNSEFDFRAVASCGAPID
eukprot:2682904-Rhodomonas_salina.2